MIMYAKINLGIAKLFRFRTQSVLFRKINILGDTIMADKKVTRKINGKEVELTTTDNFIYATNKRLQALEYQFNLLAKQHGPQYDYNEKAVDFISEKILEMLSKATDELRSPGAVSHATDFSKALQKSMA